MLQWFNSIDTVLVKTNKTEWLDIMKAFGALRWHCTHYRVHHVDASLNKIPIQISDYKLQVVQDSQHRVVVNPPDVKFTEVLPRRVSQLFLDALDNPIDMRRHKLSNYE